MAIPLVSSIRPIVWRHGTGLGRDTGCSWPILEVIWEFVPMFGVAAEVFQTRKGRTKAGIIEFLKVAAN